MMHQMEMRLLVPRDGRPTARQKDRRFAPEHPIAAHVRRYTWKEERGESSDGTDEDMGLLSVTRVGAFVAQRCSRVANTVCRSLKLFLFPFVCFGWCG